jgi:2-polyprenyl-3-methyl-5-hydroxy-6-metoxy-1,4-benzoquinol methylase
MDAAERLSIAEVSDGGVLAAHHLHRYELAAGLCAGLRVLDLGCGVGYGSGLLDAAGAATVEGVDVDEQAIATARDAYGSDTVTFTAADAVDRLRALNPDAVDVIVSFETLEHLPRIEDALDRLGELAAAGVRMILSVPNSRAFAEENEFHLTQFGFDEAREAFARLGEVTMLHQYLAEGSLIAGPGGGLRGEVAGLEGAEPEYANTFIAVTGFAPEDLAGATARLAVLARPAHNRYMIELEAANAELWRTNLRLSRGWLGKADAAAAAAVARFEVRIQALEAEIEQRDLRIDELTEVAARNDELYRQELAWRDATRYHAVDWVRDRVLAIPALGALARFSWRAVSGLRRLL